MNNELPVMEAYAHSHSTYAGDAVIGSTGQLNAQHQFNQANLDWDQQLLRQHVLAARDNQIPQQLKAQEKPMAKPTRRIVQVFICDADDNVPLDKCLVYQGEQKLTDLDDNELFFEIDIKSLLDKHNAQRTQLINKRVKERTEHLEPARIRDLKMTVVTVA